MKEIIRFSAWFTLIILSALVVSVFAMRRVNSHLVDRLRPSSEITTLRDLRDRRDNGTYTYWTFQHDDRKYIEVRTLLPFFPTLRSGWCCYVFDEGGRFVDWTPDNGEDEDWSERWGQTGRSPTNYEDLAGRLH